MLAHQDFLVAGERRTRPGIGLVIQGPLITYGQGPNNTPEGFNTLESLAANIGRANSLGFSYCLCTWEPQTPTEREVLDIIIAKRIRVLTLRPPSILDPDHRYKHHYGIRKAVDELDSQYIVKIRTDMVMPDAFWDWITNHLDDRLVVSELIMPFYLGDFIYAAKRETILTFLDSILSHGAEVLHPSITTDIGFKYFEAATGFKISKNGMLPLYTVRRKTTTGHWNHFAAKYVNVIPENVFRAIIWRGKRIEDIIRISAFKFDTAPPFPELDVNFLLSEYLRFFTKRNDRRRIVVKIGMRLLKITTRFARLPQKIARLWHRGATK